MSLKIHAKWVFFLFHCYKFPSLHHTQFVSVCHAVDSVYLQKQFSYANTYLSPAENAWPIKCFNLSNTDHIFVQGLNLRFSVTGFLQPFWKRKRKICILFIPSISVLVTTLIWLLAWSFPLKEELSWSTDTMREPECFFLISTSVVCTQKDKMSVSDQMNK